MNAKEATEYAQQLLKDSGASEEEVTQVAKLFEREKFANGFIPRPEVDRSLDAERQKRTAAEKEANYYKNDWYPKAEQAYQTNLKGIETLKRYQELYGSIDDAGDTRRAAKETGLTEEKIRELLNGSISQNNKAIMDLMDVRESHMRDFQKPLDVGGFEKFVGEQQQSGKFEGLRSSYREFTASETEKRQKESSEAEVKRRIDEAIKDDRSRRSTPTTRSREPHMVFRDRETDPKDTTSAKDDFLSALEEFKSADV